MEQVTESAIFVCVREFGLANSRRWLMRALRDRGWHVIAATAPSNDPGGIVEEGVEMVRIAFGRGGFSWCDVAGIRALHRLYKDVSPRLVHHFNAKPVVYGGIAACGLEGARVVHTVTGLGHGWGHRGLSRLSASAAYRWVAPRADAVIFQNSADRDLFVERDWVEPRRARLVVSSGVDLGRFSEPAHGAGEVETVLMVGRLLWAKGVGEFVEAARILRRRGHGVPLMLGGELERDHPDGVGRDYLETAAADGTITFCGYVADMPAALADAAVFVAPSYYREGVPRVLLEAAASGRPVVAADAPGAREIVRHGQTGLLVPPGDGAALADAIEALLQQPEQRTAMGEAAYRHVRDRFSLQAVTDQQLQIYRDLGLLDAQDSGAGPGDRQA